jgi:TRAP transporter 4TM/12TM fusion protein
MPSSSDAPAVALDELRGAEEADKLETPRFAPPLGSTRHVVRIVAVSFAMFQLYAATFGGIEQYMLRASHLAFALALVALVYPAVLRKPGSPARTSVSLLDWAFLALAVWSCLHVLLDYDRLMNRIAFSDPLTTSDLLASVALIVVVLEACRRVLGWTLVIVALAFLGYALFGNWIPGYFGHTQFALQDTLETIYLSGEGIFGIPIGVSATYVFIYIMFGAFIMRLGLMQLFVDFGMALAGRSAGGPAKVAVICSALFGTISGSGLANAITCGTFTIPLMKRVGYRGHFAAGVEAAASMGGNIMPPIMGAAAFIMADFLRVPYTTVAVAAIVPAVLYFLGIGAMVHFEALKRGIGRIPDAEIPKLGTALLKRGHLLIPVVGLVYFLFTGWSVMFAAVAGIALCVVVSFFNAATRMTPGRLLAAFEWSAMTALPVVTACAIVGIVIAVIAQTGVGVKFAGAIVALGGGKMIFTLIFAMIASLVLGLGLPTTPNYIIAAALTAPALVQFGLPAIAAHFFVFYYGILADITPPTAIAPYAVAAIAKADPNKTCMSACMIALSGLIVPFVFAYEPAMLDPLLRQPGTTLYLFLSVSISAAVGVIALSAALIGYLRCPATRVERIVLAVGAILLIVPGRVSDAIGAGLVVTIIATQSLRIRRSVDVAP